MIYRTAQIFNDLGRRKSQISSHARHFLTLNISKKLLDAYIVTIKIITY